MRMAGRCILQELPRQCWSLSVAFESEQPLHIILSENLILEAKIETAKGDEVKKITWEKETAGGASPSTVTVAEFPGKVIDSRITVEENGAMLKVTNFDHKDRGVYTITAWGTDPHFSWLHESGVISEEVGRMSLDGKVLYLKAAPCGHFTCIVSNSLGHSSATYTAGDTGSTQIGVKGCGSITKTSCEEHEQARPFLSRPINFLPLTDTANEEQIAPAGWSFLMSWP
ncbi:hypothetical protein JZ751_029737 [Albula glossodonta]|uniref:Uncharacterized protein n=1 Tax=Albula glossodonta TaxID=121402 RepID=A0A8T2NBD3_9TELE|nr:hypothetical protein JZ751_029737 [Albula glossodonta]